MRRAAALALVGALAACGGGEAVRRTPLPIPPVATTVAATASAARQSYLEQANAICLAANQEIGGRLAELPEQTVDTLSAFVGDVFVPVWRRAIAELRAITPPPGDEALLEQLWADLERQLDELEAAPRRFIERDASLLDEFSDRFDGYGLSACGTSRS